MSVEDSDSLVDDVVPHEGTWIEITLCAGSHGYAIVVPHEGTWIEIQLVEKYMDDIIFI